MKLWWCRCPLRRGGKRAGSPSLPGDGQTRSTSSSPSEQERSLLALLQENVSGVSLYITGSLLAMSIVGGATQRKPNSGSQKKSEKLLSESNNWLTDVSRGIICRVLL